MKKCYQRMYEFLKHRLNKGQIISRRMLQDYLQLRNLTDVFEKIYQIDCGCSGYWSFFDFSDRFARFANEMVRCGYLAKIERGKYLILH